MSRDRYHVNHKLGFFVDNAVQEKERGHLSMLPPCSFAKERMSPGRLALYLGQRSNRFLSETVRQRLSSS